MKPTTANAKVSRTDRVLLNVAILLMAALVIFAASKIGWIRGALIETLIARL
jgi:hypothetical protein